MDEQAKINPGQRGNRDLLRRNMSATASNQKRCDDFAEIPTEKTRLLDALLAIV